MSKLSDFITETLNTFKILPQTLRKFLSDNCELNASALTYYTLFSIVPMIALAFGIAKGFNFQDYVEAQLFEYFKGHNDAVHAIISFSKNLLKQTNGGIVAFFGFLLLCYSIIKVLSNLELSLNRIWCVTENRPFFKKIGHYIVFIVVGPLLLSLSGVLSVYFKQFFVDKAIIYWVSLSIPFLIIAIFLTWLYVYFPFRKVKILPAFIGGLTASFMYHLMQWIYISFQIGIAKYGAIYGSFAALPLFLIMFQLSWMIVLFGAEFVFCVQYKITSTWQFQTERLSQAAKKQIAILMTNMCIEAFKDNKQPVLLSDLTSSLKLPEITLLPILEQLENCGILGEVVLKIKSKRKIAYTPLHPPNILTDTFIQEALDGISLNPDQEEKLMGRLSG